MNDKPITVDVNDDGGKTITINDGGKPINVKYSRIVEIGNLKTFTSFYFYGGEDNRYYPQQDNPIYTQRCSKLGCGSCIYENPYCTNASKEQRLKYKCDELDANGFDPRSLIAYQSFINSGRAVWNHMLRLNIDSNSFILDTATNVPVIKFEHDKKYVDPQTSDLANEDIADSSSNLNSMGLFNGIGNYTTYYIKYDESEDDEKLMKKTLKIYSFLYSLRYFGKYELYLKYHPFEDANPYFHLAYNMMNDPEGNNADTDFKHMIHAIKTAHLSAMRGIDEDVFKCSNHGFITTPTVSGITDFDYPNFLTKDDIDNITKFNEEIKDKWKEIAKALSNVNEINTCLNIVTGTNVANSGSNITINQAANCIQKTNGQTVNDEAIPTIKQETIVNYEDPDVKTLSIIVIVISVIMIITLLSIMIYLSIRDSKSKNGGYIRK